MKSKIKDEIVEFVANKLGIYRYSMNDWTLRINEDGKDSGNFWGFEKQNFEVSGLVNDYLFNEEVKKVKSIGGKYIRILKKWHKIRFYLDLDELEDELNKIKEERRIKHLAKLNSIDITPYMPSPTEIKKIADYQSRGSRVNVKAIKTNEKLFRYYYAACLLDWPNLKRAIEFVIDYDYKDTLEAIALKSI